MDSVTIRSIQKVLPVSADAHKKCKLAAVARGMKLEKFVDQMVKDYLKHDGGKR